MVVSNSLKVNGKVLTVFTKIDGVIVHTANIDTRVNQIYFNKGTEEYLNLDVTGKSLLEFDEKKYRGKFNCGFCFNQYNLPMLIKTILA